MYDAVSKFELGVTLKDFDFLLVLLAEGSDHAVHGVVAADGALAAAIEDSLGEDLVLLCEEDGLVVDLWYLEGDVVGGSLVVGIEIIEPVLFIYVEEKIVVIIDHDSSWGS